MNFVLVLGKSEKAPSGAKLTHLRTFAVERTFCCPILKGMEAILNRQAVVIWPPHKRGQSLISFADSPQVAEAIYAAVVEGNSREIRLKIDGIRLNCELHPLDLDPAVIYMRASEMQTNGEDFSEEDIFVLRALASDQTVNQIATAMSKSSSAVDSRIRKLKLRMAVTTLPGLVAKAIRMKLI